jgi:small subunit ribosomal protein S8
MANNDTLAAALSKMLNVERIGKRECVVKPYSSVIKRVLEIMNQHNYVGAFEEIEDGRGGTLHINLLGNINKCGVIKPRFSTKVDDFEKWEKRYLPAKDFGIIILSTPKGIMTHTDAKAKGLGGTLIAYCY